MPWCCTVPENSPHLSPSLPVFALQTTHPDGRFDRFPPRLLVGWPGEGANHPSRGRPTPATTPRKRPASRKLPPTKGRPSMVRIMPLRRTPRARIRPPISPTPPRKRHVALGETPRSFRRMNGTAGQSLRVGKGRMNGEMALHVERPAYSSSSSRLTRNVLPRRPIPERETIRDCPGQCPAVGPFRQGGCVVIPHCVLSVPRSARCVA
jgi:hypothetical protein